MRPIWNGSISFGLINIPVRMYSAANPRQGIDLDMLHKSDHAPIRYARICRKDGQELDVAKTQTIDIQQFVDEGEIDIRYYEKPYYLEVDKGGDKAYALLRVALQKSGKLALAKFVLHEREHVGVIKPVGRALVLNQMRFPTDIREPGELSLPTDKGLTDKEIEMALKLIKQETRPFIAEDLHDTYTEELEELIKAKTKGKKPKKISTRAPEATTAKDLMAALKASLKE
ncbi:Ku protein [Candidatus Saccharibacteria bacterium]|nr:Ku protein [Candidatus Saccharibacteria bacterium]